METKTPLENLLDQDESTLEKILEDEEFVNNLVNYVIEMPKEDQNENRCFKYPFIATEIFSLDIARLVDKFFVPEKEKEKMRSGFDISPIPFDNVELGFKEKAIPYTEHHCTPRSLFLEEVKEHKIIENEECIKTVLEIEQQNQKQSEVETVLAKVMTERDFIEIEYDSDTRLKEGEISFEMSIKEPKSYPLFDRLLSVLETKEELNPVIAGYFSRVLSSIFERRPIDTLQYLYSNPEYIHNLLNHCYSTSIVQILYCILTNESKSSVYSTEKIELLEKIVNRIAFTSSVEELENFSWILTQITNQCQIKYLLNADILKTIFKVALDKKGYKHSIIIHFLLPKSSVNTDTESEPNLGLDMDSLEEVIPLQKEEYDLTALISLASETLPLMFVKLNNDIIEKGILGSERLKIVEYISALIKLKNDDIAQQIDELEVPKLLLLLMNKYPQNSLLHRYIFDSFEEALNSGIGFLEKSFSINCKLPEVLIHLNETKELVTFKNSKKSFNKAYTPYIRKFSNLIIETAKHNSVIFDYLEAIPEWIEYEATFLAVANSIENIKLADKEEEVEGKENWLSEEFLRELDEDQKDLQIESEAIDNLVDDLIDSTQGLSLEFSSPFLTSFASNNFWRSDPQYTEADFDNDVYLRGNLRLLEKKLLLICYEMN